jgi:hypothetical protein
MTPRRLLLRVLCLVGFHDWKSCPEWRGILATVDVAQCKRCPRTSLWSFGERVS